METNQNTRRTITINASNLVQLVNVLTEIREGRLPAAIEYLEYLVDSELAVMAVNLPRAPAASRDLVANPLSMVKAYRTRYPREPRPEILDNEVSKLIEDAAKEAAPFLESLR